MKLEALLELSILATWMITLASSNTKVPPWTGVDQFLDCVGPDGEQPPRDSENNRWAKVSSGQCTELSVTFVSPLEMLIDGATKKFRDFGPLY